MKLIRTKETAILPEGRPSYSMSCLSNWHSDYYYLPQPRYLVRIRYAINKNQ